MLFLLIQLGEDRYALETGQIEEIMPLVHIKHIPQTPPWVAGIFNHHGNPVPAIDLSQLALGKPAPQRLSTRIIVVRYPDPASDERLLGLIAEHAVEIMRREPRDFSDAGVSSGNAPYLGPVTSDARGLIQWIEVASLLPASVRDILFSRPVESP